MLQQPPESEAQRRAREAKEARAAAEAASQRERLAAMWQRVKGNIVYYLHLFTD